MGFGVGDGPGVGGVTGFEIGPGAEGRKVCHKAISPVFDPLIRAWPSGPNTTQGKYTTVLVDNLLINLNVALSHMRILASRPPVATVFPLGEKATLLIAAVWPVSVAESLAVLRFHIFAVRSLLADASCPESGEKASAVISPLWPVKLARRDQVAGFQILTTASAPPDASRALLGAKANAETLPLWPPTAPFSCHVAVSQ